MLEILTYRKKPVVNLNVSLQFEVPELNGSSKAMNLIENYGLAINFAKNFIGKRPCSL